MNDFHTLLELPFETLFVLAVGYLGYRLAYTGRASAHRPLDVVFLAAVFGLIARSTSLGFALYWSSSVGVHLAALVITGGSALIWRAWAQEALFKVLRHLGINDHDGFGSTWSSMLARPLPPPTQIVVRLKSGRRLYCDRLKEFNEAPMGPCLLGEDGSVALYVTHVMDEPNGTWESREPSDPAWGRAMTFVPAAEISEVEIRRLGKSNS